jgi:hypothetical protein
MSPTKKVKTEKTAPEPKRSELEQYLIDHGIEYDPKMLDPGDVENYSVGEVHVQRFEGSGYRPDMFAYYYTESEDRVKSLRPKGWLVVPRGEVFMPGCNSEKSIILCRPHAVDQAAKQRKYEARMAQSGGGTKRTQITNQNIMTTKTKSKKLF